MSNDTRVWVTSRLIYGGDPWGRNPDTAHLVAGNTEFARIDRYASGPGGRRFTATAGDDSRAFATADEATAWLTYLLGIDVPALTAFGGTRPTDEAAA